MKHITTIRQKRADGVVWVVGSINSDMTFNVGWLPQAGKTTEIMNMTRTVGGKGANQAVGAALLPLKAAPTLLYCSSANALWLL